MIRLFLSVLVFSCTLVLHGQEEWSLERCVNHALENNLNIEQSNLSVQFADIDKTQAKHARYPSLNAGVNLGSNFGRSIDPVTNEFITQTFLSNGYSVNTGVTLFNGFRISNSIKQADMNKAASEYDLDQMKRDISLNVVNTYLSALFADENLAIALSQLATSEEQLVQTERLISAGVRPANESLDILAQIANNEQMVIAAENSKQIALLGMKQLLRLDPDVEMILTVPTSLEVTTDPDVLEFGNIYAKALDNQSNVKASELRMQSADLGIKIAEASRMPTVGMFGSLQTNYSNQAKRLDGTIDQVVEQVVIINDVPVEVGFPQTVPIFSDNPYLNQLDENVFYGFGVNVNIPIYNNYAAKANIQRAKLNVINTQIQDNQLRDQLKTTIQQALSDARASKRKLNAATKSVEAQSASFDNATKKLNAGTINSFEYVTLKNNLQQAEVNAIIAKYEYIFAVKVLDFYMGNPLKI